MTGAGGHSERLWDLLSDRALEGLSQADDAELSALLAQAPEVDAHSLERASAALATALVAPQAMPARLRARLDGDVDSVLAGVRTLGGRPRGSRAETGEGGPIAFPGAAQRTAARGGTGWGWVAAAACLLMAVASWWPGSPARPAPGTRDAAVRLARAQDTVRWDWAAAGELEKAGVVGGVAWSTGEQVGLMRFTGLPLNDPAREQYQLWIFDPSQSDKTPIDGGVFNARAAPGGGTELIVPINAKLKVTGPTLFAITIEKPGGVVVSDRSRLVLLAQPPKT